MAKIKTFKSYVTFWKAIADQIPKKNHWLISGTLVRMGYAIKTKVHDPFLKVTYSLNPDVILTQEDVDKVVKEMK